MMLTQAYAGLLSRHLTGLHQLKGTLGHQEADRLIEFAEYTFLHEALEVLNLGWAEIDELDADSPILNHLYLTFSYLRDWANPLVDNSGLNCRQRMQSGKQHYAEFRGRQANLLVAAYTLSPWPFPANHLRLLESHYKSLITAIEVPLAWAGTRLYRTGCYEYVQQHLESLARAMRQIECLTTAPAEEIVAQRAMPPPADSGRQRPLSVPDLATTPATPVNRLRLPALRLATGSIGVLGASGGALLACDWFMTGGLACLLTTGLIFGVNRQLGR